MIYREPITAPTVSSPLDYALNIHFITLVMKKEYQSAASLRRITYTVTCEDKVMTRSGSFRGDSLSWDNKLYMRLKCLCTQYKSAVIPNEVKSSSQPCCNYVLVIIILAFCCLLSRFLILKCKKKKAVPELHITSAKPTPYPVFWSCENHARLKCIKSILSYSQKVLNICTRKLLTYTNCITLNLLPTSAYDMLWMQIFSNHHQLRKKCLI